MSRPSSSRPAAPPVAKPLCKIHSSAIIADKAQLIGTHSVEIGENTVIHPYAKLRAEHGRVIIGKSCTVSEKAVIGLAEGDGEVVIGDGVNIETGAEVQAKSIGDECVVEVNSKIGKGTVIGNHCKITPLQHVRPDEQLPDYTVVYGDDQHRKDTTLASHSEIVEAKRIGQEKHVEVLKKLIPNAAAKWM